MPRRRPNNYALEILQQECNRFNEKVAVGETVAVFLDSGDCADDVTTSEAQVLSGHTSVVMLKQRGMYALGRVRKKI